MSLTIDGWRFVPQALPAAPDAPCRKCKTGRVRAHHRRCPKRGLGQFGRGARVRKLEARALDAGLDLHVRRGRYGEGVSEDVGYRLVLGQYTVRASGSPAALQQRVAGMLLLSPEWVMVGRGAPGEVKVNIAARLGDEKLDAIERELRETLPGHLLISVRGIDSPGGNTILPP